MTNEEICVTEITTFEKSQGYKDGYNQAIKECREWLDSCDLAIERIDDRDCIVESDDKEYMAWNAILFSPYLDSPNRFFPQEI